MKASHRRRHFLPGDILIQHRQNQHRFKNLHGHNSKGTGASEKDCGQHEHGCGSRCQKHISKHMRDGLRFSHGKPEKLRRNDRDRKHGIPRQST